MLTIDSTVAVAYLARGVDRNWLESVHRFVDSYILNNPGLPHKFYVIYKGFACNSDLLQAKKVFAQIPNHPIYLDDDKFDIGAYIEWANIVDEEIICVLNSASEILSEYWLHKLFHNLLLMEIGVVGATASFESLNVLNGNFKKFPNMHLRSTGFMIDRRLFCKITRGVSIFDKIDAFYFESGRHSLTNKVIELGGDLRLVGRNGRGYSSKFWRESDTFRLRDQRNLLIADNQTRNFMNLRWSEKREFSLRSWGH